MANISRVTSDPSLEELDSAVLTSRGDVPWPLPTPDPELRIGRAGPRGAVAAPTVQKSGDPQTPALSSLSSAAASASAGAPPDMGVDLDAIDSRFHSGRCICPVCSGPSRYPLGRSAATSAPAGATSSTSPKPMVNLQTLADYLTTGYWRDAGTYTRKYNLTSSGTGAKNGVITYNVTGWSSDSNGLTADRQALTREVFKVYSAVLGIKFQEVSGTAGDIRFSDNKSGAYAYTASSWYADSTRTSAIIDYSVVNVEKAWYDGGSNYNTYTPQTFFHEIGHALGLGHQGQYNYTGTPLTYDSSAQFANDSWQATMMSYWDQSENTTTGASFAWLQTPMAVDWIGLNDLYRSQGYSTDNAFQGNTIYGVGTNISASDSQIWNLFSTYAGNTAYTLVDGSGYDTLDVSNFAADQLINLAPSSPTDSTAPSVCNIGGKVGNLSIASGTIIEAATGGAGNDTFYGNASGNTLRGNGGNDIFYDSLGSDVYYGDTGTDRLYYSEPIAQFSYSLSGDSLLISHLSGSPEVDQVWNGVDYLSFGGIDYAYGDLIQGVSGPAMPLVSITTVNGTLTSGAVTNSTTLSFSGNLSVALAADQSIAFYRDGLAVGTAQPIAPDATSWSFSLQESAGTNNVTYTARVLGSGGQAGLLSNAFLLTVDTVAPQVTVDSLDTYDTTPLLGGTINDASAKVTVTVAGITRTAVNNGAGRWSLQWNDTLTAGQTYNVVATAQDAAGNSANDSSSDELILRGDDYAANSGTSGLVNVGGSSAGVLEQLGDRDWFAIDLVAGRTYEFRLNGNGLADPLLRLYSGAGIQLASNDDISYTNRNSLISFTATSTGRHYLEAAAYSDSGSGGYSLSATDVTPPTAIYFSLANAVTTSSASVMGGLTARTNDIIGFDGGQFSTWLDGNANGLSGAVLRDFYMLNSNELLLAFQAPVTLSSIAFDASDLAKLTRNGSGFAISMYFDGSDVGLTSSSSSTAEAIDAITGLPDGSLLISTRGAGSVTGINNFSAEDLLKFTPTTIGSTTTGTWSLYADLSDVGLSTNNSNLNENVVAVDVAANGRLYMATQGNASASGLSAANEDVFALQTTSLGSNTGGSFHSPLFFDGSVYGLSSNAIQGLDVPF